MEIIGIDYTPLQVQVDNQSTIAVAKNQGCHGKSKHVQIKHFYVQEFVQNNEVRITYGPTENMPADILTKPLRAIKHKTFVESLGLLKSSG